MKTGLLIGTVVADKIQRTGDRLPMGTGLNRVRAWSSHLPDHNVLHDLVQSSRSWNRERVPLPRRLRGTLWAFIPVEFLWGIWLVAILTGATPCSGPICTVATLHQHAALLLPCAITSVIGLLSLFPLTRGLSHCNDREFIAVAATTAAGCIALLGIAALLTGVMVVLMLIGIFVFGVTAT
jgi:hypothetical protein